MTGREKNPILSVIVPVYNTEQYLEKALDSILASTLKDFELILVDDGSTDGSPTICDRYRDENPERDIKVYHTENHGLSAVRNFGLARASGKYMIYTDSDDWIEPELYETLVDAAEKTQAQAAICGIRYYDEQTGKFEYFKDSLFPQRLAGKVFDFRSCGAVAKGLLDCSTCNKAVLRSFVESNGFFCDEKCNFSEDSRYWAELFFTAERLTLVRGEFYNYRINQTRKSNCVNAKKTYASFAETMRCVMGSMIRRDVFRQYSGEFIAYMTMQFIVAYSAVARERKGAFYRECAAVVAAAGRFRRSKEFSILTRWCIFYVYGVLRHLPYWCGRVALAPFALVSNPGLKKVIRKLTVKG